MKFDAEGHINITPEQVYRLAVEDPRRLIDHYLTHGTPYIFSTYDAYYDFLREISNRFEVHPRNLILRGSSKLGFSIAPKVGKVWSEVGEKSDLDLAIIDAPYYERIDQEVIRWEKNRAHWVSRRDAKEFADRQQDRLFNCCRIKDLPRHLFPHHFHAMDDIARMEHCGRRRDLNAFIYRDWWALHARFEFDLKELRDGIPKKLSPPPERPFRRPMAARSRADRPVPPAGTQPPATPEGGSSPSPPAGPGSGPQGGR
jgi:hypothetical protein